MKPPQLTKRIKDLTEKLNTKPSEGIRFDFNSFSEPEQLVILKNQELHDKYRDNWTKDIIMENIDLIIKCNDIVIRRSIELFLYAMPRAMMLDEVDQILFNINFRCFMERWIECQKNTRKWTKEKREAFLRDRKIAEKKSQPKVKLYGEENNN